MDIFTTALTRVVPVPIKPVNLKVKALAKSAATDAVSDDISGLEEQPLYIKKTSIEQSSDKKSSDNKADSEGNINESSVELKENTGQHIDVFDDNDNVSPENDGKSHLDIFV
ncbi:MAG: hypothetical protein WBC60_18385 [Cognaticolwellia sp.]|jgi:hypothetical protein